MGATTLRLSGVRAGRRCGRSQRYGITCLKRWQRFHNAPCRMAGRRVRGVRGVRAGVLEGPRVHSSGFHKKQSSQAPRLLLATALLTSWLQCWSRTTSTNIPACLSLDRERLIQR